jgi:hypothetical protein
VFFSLGEGVTDVLPVSVNFSFLFKAFNFVTIQQKNKKKAPNLY